MVWNYCGGIYADFYVTVFDGLRAGVLSVRSDSRIIFVQLLADDSFILVVMRASQQKMSVLNGPAWGELW